MRRFDGVHVGDHAQGTSGQETEGALGALSQREIESADGESQSADCKRFSPSA